MNKSYKFKDPPSLLEFRTDTMLKPNDHQFGQGLLDQLT